MTGGRCAYLYVLFEFQSTIDRLMPLRILNYMLLLYEDLIKQKEVSADELLPPVFPVVVYTGAAPAGLSRGGVYRRSSLGSPSASCIFSTAITISSSSFVSLQQPSLG